MYGHLVCLYVCASGTCSGHRGQRRVLDVLEVKVHLSVSCLVGAGNGSQSSERAVRFLTTEPSLWFLKRVSCSPTNNLLEPLPMLLLKHCWHYANHTSSGWGCAWWVVVKTGISFAYYCYCGPWTLHPSLCAPSTIIIIHKSGLSCSRCQR